MFGLFKNKKKETQVTTGPVALYAVANGELVSVDQVNDPVFSQKMMGDGYAVIPADGNIFAPAAGRVISVFPTKHAVGLKLDNGLEILLHMGLDTVQLEGAGFDTVVKEGDVLTADTRIATVDLDVLKEAGKDTVMIVVITNFDQVETLSLDKTGAVTAQETIGSVSAKA